VFSRLWRWLGLSPPARPRARYDAASQDPMHRRHWANADPLSPNAAASAADRKTIRERARYEVANNSFAQGAVNSVADDAVGSGPRLQIVLPGGAADEAAREVEASFSRWADESGLAETLRLLVRSGCVDGECFALLTDDPTLRHPVKLRLRPFEADRVTDPDPYTATPGQVEGIRFDAAGNPESYAVLRQHPGDAGAWASAAREFDRVPAGQVVHWFRADRPGQARGVSWLTPALHLFAQLRRYTMAVLAAAETAADIAGVLESDLPPDPGTPAGPGFKPFEEVELPRAALLTLPPGWKVSQMRPEQPVTHFGDFRVQLLVEIARTLQMPLNRISGNSSGYNYSSGRLDHVPYHGWLWLLRDRLRLVVLLRALAAWLDEAALVPGELPDGLPPVAVWRVDFNWDAFGTIDDEKEAKAAELLLKNHLTTLAEQCAARGLRWDEVLRQRQREQELADELGLKSAAPAPAPSPPQAAPERAPEQEEPEDGEGAETETEAEAETQALSGAGPGVNGEARP
jgi:lambda family phage portal protein